jgi:predicted MPP superfamily phosphohydrolase
MWIAILVTGLVVAIAHAVYFGRRVTRALEIVLPGTRRWHGAGRRVHLVIGCSLPVLLVGFIVYALVARPDSISPPDSRIYAYAVELPFWFVTVWSLQVSLLVLPIDVLHRVAARLGVLAGQRWVWRRNALVLAIAGAFLVYVPLRAVMDGRGLEVRVHEVVRPDLAPALDGLTIALVADMQADQFTGEARLAQLVDAVNAARPDLVVIAGDMITRAPRYAEVAAQAAGRLRARLGVLACIGDHENFSYRDRARSVREVREAMARHGVPMLDNEVRTIDAGGGATVAVVLATNNYVSRIAPEDTARLLQAARGADLRVLCSHQASAALLGAARDAGVELFLAGHTHGGQVVFWLPFAELTPARFETPFLYGAHRIGDMTLVVTSGLGMSVAPLRYRSPASIDLVRLRKGASR